MSEPLPGRRARPLLLALAALATTVPADAQTPEPETVPLELVQVLSRGGRAPEVLVGRLPEAIARQLTLPEDSRVIGSLVHGAFSVSAIADPGSPAAAQARWVARLLEAGWTRFERPSRGGFESGPEMGLQFCRGDSASVSLGISRNPRGGSYVHVTQPRARRHSICATRSGPDPWMRGSPIPPLEPPPGSVHIGSGAGGGSDEWDARARIESDLPVDELVAHYAAQLRAHGWEPLGRTSGPGVATALFRVRDPEGATWHAVLVGSTPSADADRFVFLRLTRIAPAS